MKSLKTGFTLFCLLALVPLGVHAADEETARNNFSSELVECAAYYDISAEGIRRTGNLEAAARVEATAKSALDMARRYSRDDVVLARYKLSMEDQIKTIDGNYSNLSLLMLKYKDICKQALETPQVRLNYWEKK
jgi:hypothetical protein